MDRVSMNSSQLAQKNIFELYYSNKEKYSYLFQSYVLCSRVSFILQCIKDYPNHIIICERSHLTDYYIFATVLHTLNLMTDLEYKIYTDAIYL
jgi:deoxyadenosine/deoxycytidine kinase